GHYELFVPYGSEIFHYYRSEYSDPTQWVILGSIYSAGGTGQMMTKIERLIAMEDCFPCTIIDGNTDLSIDNRGAFHVIAFASIGFSGKQKAIFHVQRDVATSAWNTLSVQTAKGPILDVSGSPGFIQSSFGNLEIVVPQGKQLRHYWK